MTWLITTTSDNGEEAFMAQRKFVDQIHLCTTSFREKNREKERVREREC